MITRYEIVAEHPDGRAYLIAYTPRRSRPGILAAMRDRADSIIAKLAISGDDVLTWSTKPTPRCFTGDWTIKFSGRTQLDAKSRHGSGPLPHICD